MLKSFTISKNFIHYEQICRKKQMNALTIISYLVGMFAEEKISSHIPYLVFPMDKSNPYKHRAKILWYS